jgi:pilus assembly protein CpaC
LSYKLQNLNITVSLPNGEDSAGNPQVTSNEIRTNITVKSKESAVIGGIVQSNSNTSYDKNDPDPTTAEAEGDTAQASSLFEMLRSKSYTTKKSQFVVFITPEILDTATQGTEEIRKKFRKRER